jgi:predicted PurR-regulated permease PerM
MMEPVPIRRLAWYRPLLLGVALVAALYVVYLVRSIWPPVAVAFLFAMTLDPVVDRLENRGWRRIVATAFIFILFLGLLIAALAVFIPPLTSQTSDIAGALGGLFPDSDQPGLVGPVERFLTEVHAPPGLRAPILRAAREATDRLSQSLEAVSLYLLSVAPNLIWLVIVPILTFYALSDFHLIYTKALLLVPREHRHIVQEITAEVSAVFGKYMRGLGLVCLLNGLATALLLVVFGIPYPLILALLAGTLYAVPYVGPVVAIGLIGLISLMQGTLVGMLLLVGVLIFINSVLFDQLITPRLLGRQVGLHPILSIIAFLAGNVLAGVPGLLLAVPVAASLQIVILHLVPKLRQELELKSLDALQQQVPATERDQARSEAAPLDEHYRLGTVIENVE